MRHQDPGYHNLCVLSCLAPVVNINIKTGINTKQQGTKEVLTPQRLYIKSLSSLSLPKWSSMRGLCPKQSSGSGLAQSLWPLFLNFWNEIAKFKRNNIHLALWHQSCATVNVLIHVYVCPSICLFIYSTQKHCTCASLPPNCDPLQDSRRREKLKDSVSFHSSKDKLNIVLLLLNPLPGWSVFAFFIIFQLS